MPEVTVAITEWAAGDLEYLRQQAEGRAEEVGAAGRPHGAAAWQRLAAHIASLQDGTMMVVPRKLLSEAHACMRACGWQLAPAAEHVGDGVLATAVAFEKFAEDYRALVAASPLSDQRA